MMARLFRLTRRDGAVLAHAGTGDAWITVFYDQIGAANFVPEGTGQARIVMNGPCCFKGGASRGAMNRATAVDDQGAAA